MTLDALNGKLEKHDMNRIGGIYSVTVPGAVDGWFEGFGKVRDNDHGRSTRASNSLPQNMASRSLRLSPMRGDLLKTTKNHPRERRGYLEWRESAQSW
ncbi:MAG: hypothetical protein CM1200mP14_08810 [Gammaproteobacteria bacterium]|nr:MAG: hypothetical protein CM1200mP14_08810 [Gammaproteobacteria bacterium]